jgi:putative membrane protein
MKNILINWVLSAVAIFIAAYVLPGIYLADIVTVFVVALVFGILNAIVRPILIILTLPINILTLGLFTFIVNAIIVSIASALVPGFQVASFGWALLFSIVLSLVNMGIGLFRKDE